MEVIGNAMRAGNGQNNDNNQNIENEGGDSPSEEEIVGGEEPSNEDPDEEQELDFIGEEIEEIDESLTTRGFQPTPQNIDWQNLSKYRPKFFNANIPKYESVASKSRRIERDILCLQDVSESILVEPVNMKDINSYLNPYEPVNIKHAKEFFLNLVPETRKVKEVLLILLLNLRDMEKIIEFANDQDPGKDNIKLKTPCPIRQSIGHDVKAVCNAIQSVSERKYNVKIKKLQDLAGLTYDPSILLYVKPEEFVKLIENCSLQNPAPIVNAEKLCERHKANTNTTIRERYIEAIYHILEILKIGKASEFKFFMATTILIFLANHELEEIIHQIQINIRTGVISRGQNAGISAKAAVWIQNKRNIGAVKELIKDNNNPYGKKGGKPAGKQGANQPAGKTPQKKGGKGKEMTKDGGKGDGKDNDTSKKSNENKTNKETPAGKGAQAPAAKGKDNAN